MVYDLFQLGFTSWTYEIQYAKRDFSVAIFHLDLDICRIIYLNKHRIMN